MATGVGSVERVKTTGAARSPVAEPAAGLDRRDAEEVGWWRRFDTVALALVVAAGVGLRFVTTSPLWLDEALSVNIAQLPLGDIPEALRHDGHPPLYYFLLHGWISVFGSGDVAMRMLSGLFGVALLPLTFVAARRLGGVRAGWAAVLVLALSPFAVRYSTETRMYALVSLLVLAGWLIGQDALRRPTPVRLAALAALSGVLLLSHYWVLWLLGAVLLLLAGRVWRGRRGGFEAVRSPVLVGGALLLGFLPFLAWLPSLRYQAAHTGTPWADPVRPTAVAANSLVDLGGTFEVDGALLGAILLVLTVIGLLGRAIDRRRSELDLATRPSARAPALIVVVTLGLAIAAGYATSSTFATRYLAVIFPFIVLLVGLGLACVADPAWFRAVAAVVVVLGAVGSIHNVFDDRTQTGNAADIIEASQGDGLVLSCPDQLGPALSRLLTRSRFEQRSYPAFADARRVDWVDYEERLATAQPAAFAEEAVERAGDRTLWLIWSTGYRTHEGTCQALVSELGARRPGESVLTADEEFYEKASLYRFDAP